MFAATPALSAERLAGPYPAEVLRVIDGDTVEVRVHIWLGLDQTVHVRLRGIDAPEMHGHCPGEREKAQMAKDYLERTIAGQSVSLTDIGVDKYGGRVDAWVRLSDSRNLSERMLSAGLARAMAGKGRKPWC